MSSILIDSFQESTDGNMDTELKIFDFSHYPLPKRDRQTLRIFYNNVNGLEINEAIDTVVNKAITKRKNNLLRDVESVTKIESLIQQLYTWEVNIAALAEPCVEWRDAIPRKTIKDIGKKYDSSGHWTVATSNSSVGSFLKPGGALVYSTGEYASRQMETGTDPWGYGRWAYKRYRGKGNQSLLVISGYRVSKRSGNPGPSTAWFQQKILLGQDNRDTEPAEAFLTDLTAWIEKSMDANTDIILLLDANEQWGRNAKIAQFANNLQLLNLNEAGEFQFPASHPSLSNPSRSTTIDYCLCTNRVVQCVTYATMAPYDLGSLGDHRGILIDINIAMLWSMEGSDRADTISRKLSMSNPTATKKYLQYVEDGFAKQRIVQRASKLYAQFHNRTKTKWEVKTIYEKLDTEIFHICLKSEQKCRPTVSGRYSWSPKLAQAIKRLAYWKARQRYENENAVIVKLGEESEIMYTHCSPEEILQKVNESRHYLIQIQQESISHRQEHLEKLADSYATQNNVSKVHAIRELISHESVRQTFSLLREKMHQKQSGQLSKLWVAMDDSGEYCKDIDRKQILETKESVHTQLLARNTRHLSQAKDTPFATGKLARALKWDGTGDLGTDILSGEILNKEKFSRIIQLYFESLRTKNFPKDLEIIKPYLSLAEYKSFWKKKKEATVTSPFGLHIGHFKAALTNPEILNVHRIMLLLPFQTGSQVGGRKRCKLC